MSEENFEKQLNLLEQAVERLESGDLSLEESLQIYEEGMLRIRHCREALALAEQKVEILQENADGMLKSKPFPTSEDA